MAIESVTEWNSRIVMCACCEMPEHPAPRTESQNKTGTSGDRLNPINGDYRYGELPFIKPEGEATDDMPCLYDTTTYFTYGSYSIDYVQSHGITAGPPKGYWASLFTYHFSSVLNGAGPWVDTASSSYIDSDGYSSTAGGWDDDVFRQAWLGGIPDGSIMTIVIAPAKTKTATEWKDDKGIINHHSPLTDQPTLPTGPDGTKRWWDRTEHFSDTVTRERPFTLADRISAAKGKASSTAWGATSSTLGVASTVSAWPTIGSFPTAAWTAATVAPILVGGYGSWAPTTVRPLRYRLGVPPDYAGSYYKAEWDEVLFPQGYDARIPDPNYTPPAQQPPGGWPPVPTIPDPAAPQPSLVSHKSWEYSEDEFSEWFEVAAPDVRGEIRIRNLCVIAYRTPWGTRPQYVGERWKPA